MKENRPLMFIENVKNDIITTPNQEYFDSRYTSKANKNELSSEEKNLEKDKFLFLEKCYKAQKVGINITINLELVSGESITGIVKNLSNTDLLVDDVYIKLSEISNIKIIKTEII